MKPSAWLAEFHRRWQAARSRSPEPATRPYGMSWPVLLEATSIVAAEDQATATREAEALAEQGHLVLKRHRYRRYLIERVTLPLAAEDWLHALFASESSEVLLDRSLALLDKHRRNSPPTAEWSALLDRLHQTFSAGGMLRPFSWRKPDDLDQILTLVHGLSSRDWEPGTLVRAASVSLGCESKLLERRQRTLARALSELVGAPTSLADLGLVMSESMLLSQGPLVLHFPDGEHKDFSGLAPHSLSASDLERASAIETLCTRLLTIENSKTTFRQFAAANRDGTTLLVASSFPTPALRCLLRKLPHEIEHHHFGDTDPTGFLILLKLRQASPRPVSAFHMEWRPASPPHPLTRRDQELLQKLLSTDQLKDCQPTLRQMQQSDDRGQFEQETLGPPTRRGWPFFG